MRNFIKFLTGFGILVILLFGCKNQPRAPQQPGPPTPDQIKKYRIEAIEKTLELQRVHGLRHQGHIIDPPRFFVFPDLNKPEASKTIEAKCLPKEKGKKKITVGMPFDIKLLKGDVKTHGKLKGRFKLFKGDNLVEDSQYQVNTTINEGSTNGRETENKIINIAPIDYKSLTSDSSQVQIFTNLTFDANLIENNAEKELNFVFDAIDKVVILRTTLEGLVLQRLHNTPLECSSDKTKLPYLICVKSDTDHHQSNHLQIVPLKFCPE